MNAGFKTWELSVGWDYCGVKRHGILYILWCITRIHMLEYVLC